MTGGLLLDSASALIDRSSAELDDVEGIEDRDGVPRPYVHVRRGLEALIDRKSFYRLVAAAEPDADGRLVLRSQGAVFALEG